MNFRQESTAFLILKLVTAAQLIHKNSSVAWLLAQLEWKTEDVIRGSRSRFGDGTWRHECTGRQRELPLAEMPVSVKYKVRVVDGLPARLPWLSGRWPDFPVCPFPSGNHHTVIRVWVCFFTCSLLAFCFISHLWMKSCGPYPFPSNLFYLA